MNPIDGLAALKSIGESLMLIARTLRPLIPMLCWAVGAGAQTAPPAAGPATSESFGHAIDGFQLLRNFVFGRSGASTVRSLDDLAEKFDPYGIAGTGVINKEWQRYQKFNPANFVFTESSLNLTATIRSGGGLVPGGIHSGQIWSKEVFQPGITGQPAYAFEIRMKIPDKKGTWPAFWLYSKPSNQRSDGSEIDHPEFFVMTHQSQFDWTGNTHGPGTGSDFYSIKTNKWFWRPGVDFSADYHDFQTLWTPDAVYKYVDGKLVLATHFKWTAPTPAQMGVNLAVGSDDPSLIGLQPASLADFPCALSIAHIKVWGKPQAAH
jgi:hypothetical protein